MSTTSPVINLKRGYSAFITAISNAQWIQKATFTVRKQDGTPITSQWLSGKGARALMTTTDGSTKYLAFGPYDGLAKITVTLEYADASDSKFNTSNMLTPIDIATETNHVPAAMKSDIIMAQNLSDGTKNDCIATVLQYKPNQAKAVAA